MNILPIPGRGHARVPAEKAAQGRLVGKIDTRHDRLQVHRRFPEQRLDLENREADDPVPCRLPADLVHQVGQVLRSDPEPLGEIRHVPVGRMFLDDRPHEPECQFFLMGISSLFSLRIIEIDGVDVPIEHPQKLHYRLTATDDGSIFGTVSQQVAEIQEPPDILFPRLRGDMRAHVKKETGPGPPQGTEGIGKHIVRYAEKPDPEIVAYLLDGNQLPGKQGKHHPAHDPEAMAENLYRSRTRQADASDPFHKVYRTIGYR